MTKKPTYEELDQRVKELERDIVEGKRAEEERLLQSEITANMSEGVYLIRVSDGVILYTNPRFEEIFGYGPGEMVGKYVSIVTAPTDMTPEETVDHIVGIMKQTGVWKGEIKNIKKDGTPFWCYASASIFEHPEYGEIIILVHTDIDERKQVEEALRESEKHYRQLVELCPDIVAVHSEGKIVFINSAGARLIGAAKPEQLIEKPIMDFVHPDYREIIKERVREMRKKRRAVPLIEEKFIRLDGTYIDVEVAAMPFIYQDKEAVQIVARDITKRKLAEEKIQASLKEKEVLLKEIHHRVKNNLQIISSLLDMSRRRTENQEAVDLLSDARAKVHTMVLIHAQLYQSDRFDQIDMGRHIQELFNFLAAIYETKSRFVTYLAKDSDVSLELTQAIPCALVLNEVISNAFKHAFKEGEKGTIEASIQRTADDTILIRIKDDGKGIPEEIDIDKTNGLGLKLARNLVQSQLGGKIRVEGNGGTEIVIEFNTSKEEREYA